MKSPFTRSMYKDYQDFLVDESEQWKRIAKEALERLMDIEEVGYSEDTGDYYWVASGERVGG